jgi:hypothetical protein
MSGALVNLVAKGAQDAFLTGKPEVSFFQSMYKRHTNFAQFPVELFPIGSADTNSTISLPITRKGDLLTYIWADCGSSEVNTAFGVEGASPSLFRLYVGGQLIEEHDAFYGTKLYTKFLTNNSAKGNAILSGAALETGKFLPMHFSCCDEFGCALPLVALQYHDVEVRIQLGSGNGSGVKYYANYIQLDTEERAAMANAPREMLITQVQRIDKETNSTFDLSYFNHPVKAMLWGGTLAGNTGDFAIGNTKLSLNGVDTFDPMPPIYFSHVQTYHHSSHGNSLQQGTGAATEAGGLYMYSFALKADKYQPNGTCNFSRLDNGKLDLGTTSGTASQLSRLYGVNYNIFRVQNGMGGLAFAN